MMTPQDVENCIDRIVEYRDAIITGTGSYSYTPGVFEKISADLRALRKIQAYDAGQSPPMHKAPGGDGLYRMLPKWAGEPGH